MTRDTIDLSPLFTPVQLGTIHLKNRFAMAPMTRQFSPGGVPDDSVIAYYQRRASSLGLIITEGTYVDHPAAGTSDRVPRMDPAGLAGWRRVVDAVHTEGGLIIPQIWHLGVTRKEGAPPFPEAPVLSPSGLDANGLPKGRAATPEEIAQIRDAFIKAALDAHANGFDGVEIHGAHGYLLDQFFWPQTNRRTDAWGGSAENRARLSTEIVLGIRQALPDFPIIYRFSQWKGGHYDARIAETPQDLEHLLTPLVQAGVTAFHASTRRYWLTEFDSDLTLAAWTRKITGLPVITVGSIGVQTAFLGNDADTSSTSLAPLVKLLEAGHFDAAALGRAILADPLWVEKIRDGRADEIHPYAKGLESELF